MNMSAVVARGSVRLDLCAVVARCINHVVDTGPALPGSM